MPAERTWLVMLRDVSSAVRVRGMGGATAALVLDPESLNVLAAEVAPTADEALLMAVDAAGTSPAIGIAARPALVHYLGSPVQAVTRALQALSEKLGWELPVVAVAEPSRVAEDVFDSFVGHMSGRQQPQEFASPDLWEQLYGLAWRFFLSSLWERWADEVDLSIRLSVDGHESELAGVVLGNAGIQFGLVLYPGPEPPPQLRKWKRATDVPVPDGTLMFHLDAASRLPADLVGKAVRYGWPESQERVPLLLRLLARKPCDLGAADVRRLALALAAVLELDSAGPQMAGAEPIRGSFRLAGDGQVGRFSIRQRPPEAEEAGVRLALHEVAYDLVPEGSPVALGALPPQSLLHLRGRAQFRRSLPDPPTTTIAIPLIAIHPRGGEGKVIAARIADDDPLGVSTVERQGNTMAVLVCAQAGYALLEVPSDAVALTLFQTRLQAASGFHVVVVADEDLSRDNGEVFGLFECRLPVPPRAKGHQRRQPSRRRRSGRKPPNR